MSDITLSFWLGIAVIFQVTSRHKYCVFARLEIENGNILLLLGSLLVSSSMKESTKFIFSRNFPALVTCKTSKFVTKETSFLLPQTPWYLLKPINFISRWGDLLTYVGYNFGEVKISTFNTSRWNAPQCYDSIALCITLMWFYCLHQLGWQQN